VANSRQAISHPDREANMNPTRTLCWAVCAVAVVSSGKRAWAKEPDPAKIAAAYEKAGTPGEEHRQLQKMVGKWNLTMKSWMLPNQPARESKGTAEVKPILGDRFVEMKVNATFMEKPLTGVSTLGYDNTKKKFVGTWIDSMSTGIMRSEGTADSSGNIITTQAVTSDPLTGKEAHTRIVEKWENDNKFTDEFYEKRGGKEMKTMEIVYSRASANAAPPPSTMPSPTPGVTPPK
jgi:hypothetical protein